MFRMTILAARRVLPPDLMAPANESKPFMKESGPEAVPPEERPSWAPRSDERFDPVPEPNLNNIPSVLARVRIESIESPQELMKQALPWGLASMPTLNQTGELKDATWLTRIAASSSWKASRSAAVLKYPPLSPNPVMVAATRSINCLTEVSRSAWPTRPWKYFCTTMFVAVCDQDLGTSTFFCSKMTSPFSDVIAAVRSSHSIASYGETDASEYIRVIVSPRRLFPALFSFSVETVFSSFSVVPIRPASPFFALFAECSATNPCPDLVEMPARGTARQR